MNKIPILSLVHCILYLKYTHTHIMYKFKIYANVMYKFSEGKKILTKTEEFAYIVIRFCFESNSEN